MFWTLQKMSYRAVHYGLKAALPLMRFPMPEVLAGPGIIKKLPEKIAAHGLKNVLVVTDQVLAGMGLMDGLLTGLNEKQIKYTLFDKVQPNPTIGNVEDGVKNYLANGCQGIVAFGGGSPMDCAKIIGARVSNNRRSVMGMKGKFRIFKKLPPFFAVPTTAGTGSETTVAAVITDPDAHAKFTIISMKIVPLVAVLDPELMVGLPPHITAATGMDALTHAIEAYIGLCGSAFTDNYAEKAVRIIVSDLEAVYLDGSDLEKRTNLAWASFYAGAAFTRTSVGYVHAVAHNLGGIYGTPHGLANAVVLPYVLEMSEKDAREKLAKLAITAGLGQGSESPARLSSLFIQKIKAMNANMGIPEKIKELREADIPMIVERVLKEANLDYPVPTIIDRAQCEQLVRKLLP